MTAAEPAWGAGAAPPPAAVAEPMKWADVDLDAIRANAAALVAAAGPGCELMAMVKANGYGHGAVAAAGAALAGGATRLGVSSAEEALHLRGAGIDAPVLVAGWSHPATHAALVAAGVELTVFSTEAIRAAADAARRVGRPAQCHLELDTGMHRSGADPALVDALLDEAATPGVRVAGVFTHFADADGEDLGFTEEQHARFLPAAERVADRHPGVLVHAANSAAMLRLPATRHDCVRPGIALYGYLPAHCEGAVAVRPALTVATWVTHVLTVPAGDTVGYERTWRAQRRSRVALVAAGYADGIARAQSNRGHVLVRGVACPIVGIVSMDQLSVDVSELDDVTVGDRAVLIGGGDGGERLGADRVAAAIGTTAYEVLCAVSSRVVRRARGGARVAAGAQRA